jgi:hypothetical protein
MEQSMRKETYYRKKRDLLQKEKRPTVTTPRDETAKTPWRRAYQGLLRELAHEVQRRDLLHKEKRPLTEGKETYGISRALLRELAHEVPVDQSRCLCPCEATGSKQKWKPKP